MYYSLLLLNVPYKVGEEVISVCLPVCQWFTSSISIQITARVFIST